MGESETKPQVKLIYDKKEYDKNEGFQAVKQEQKPKLVQPISSMCASPYVLQMKKQRDGVMDDKKVSPIVIENGDFEEEADWLLVGRTPITGLSTTKGRKLEDNEIVHFAFPNIESKTNSGYWASSRAVNAASGIVRFSTKRSGEIGRLSMEWSKCLISLVNSKKVKILGSCVLNLSLMEEIMLYISFYVHHSIFGEDGNSSWKLESSSNIDSTIYPLLTLFKLPKKSLFQKYIISCILSHFNDVFNRAFLAEFTPEELDTRKRATLESDLNEAVSALPMAK
ncbi:hypothetical protein LXL04_007004 [Taraxacum kok-saghyz]